MTDNSNNDDEDGIRLSADQKRRQRGRSIAIGLALVGLVVLFYLVTLVKMGPGVLDKGMY